MARRLAQHLKMELVEMDETIEAKQGMTINEIFAQKGEDGFRNIESALVERISKRENMVVSCGGGAVLRADNVQNMKKSGKIVFLTATPQTIFERVRYSTNRPLLNGNMNVEYIETLMEKRRSVYEAAADIVVTTDGKSEEELLEVLKKNIIRL